MTVVATAFIKAALEAGMISTTKIKKDGTVKKSAYSNACWPRLKRNQPAFTRKEMN